MTYLGGMKRGAWISVLRRRWLVLLTAGVGFGLLNFQVAYTVHILHHLHPDSRPTGRLPATDRDCIVLHAGAVPEPPQDAAAPIVRDSAPLPEAPERRPEVAAVDAPIARAPPVSPLIGM